MTKHAEMGKTARKTAPGRPFRPGRDPRRGHGKKGRSGRKPLVYKEALKGLEPKALQTIEEVMHCEESGVRLRAAQDVLDRLYGKARQTAEVDIDTETLPDGEPIPIILAGGTTKQYIAALRKMRGAEADESADHPPATDPHGTVPSGQSTP